MIQARELRINNYVFSKKHKGLIVQIHSVLPTYVRIWANPLTYYELKDIDPIPLTKKILTKYCYCKKSEDGWMFRTPNGVWITAAANGRFFVDGCKEGAYIDFLHEFQNIVFALSKQELEVNL